MKSSREEAGHSVTWFMWSLFSFCSLSSSTFISLDPCTAGSLTRDEQQDLWPEMNSGISDPRWTAGSLTRDEQRDLWPEMNSGISDPRWTPGSLTRDEQRDLWPEMNSGISDPRWTAGSLTRDEQRDLWPEMNSGISDPRWTAGSLTRDEQRDLCSWMKELQSECHVERNRSMMGMFLISSRQVTVSNDHTFSICEIKWKKVYNFRSFSTFPNLI